MKIPEEVLDSFSDDISIFLMIYVTIFEDMTPKECQDDLIMYLLYQKDKDHFNWHPDFP